MHRDANKAIDFFMECLNSGFSSIQFSMDQFGITLCDIGLYEKEDLVQRPGLDFGDSLEIH
jgi:hypothetical protein